VDCQKNASKNKFVISNISFAGSQRWRQRVCARRLRATKKRVQPKSGVKSDYFKA
jgi:hypothetical protein